jgi:hypothetical protein
VSLIGVIDVRDTIVDVQSPSAVYLSAPSEKPSGLTPRQREVLQLLAEGRAARLCEIPLAKAVKRCGIRWLIVGPAVQLFCDQRCNVGMTRKHRSNRVFQFMDSYPLST